MDKVYVVEVWHSRNYQGILGVFAARSLASKAVDEAQKQEAKDGDKSTYRIKDFVLGETKLG
jgi:hypothetical protein